tara:strand:- start:57 stop:635 length:579 start_codon:yes stop_codon:yes gene_type:complete
MRSLFENWRGYIKETKLRIFDFDDTLAKTDAKVGVTTPGGETIYMDPAEFSQHKMDDRNQYDFSDFDKVINPREISQVTNILRNVVQGESEVVILTARDPNSQESVENWLESIGIDSSRINFIGLANPSPEAKANWIENKIIDGVTEILFLDDSGKNIAAVKKLEREYKDKIPNLKIDARAVSYGEAMEENF